MEPVSINHREVLSGGVLVSAVDDPLKERGVSAGMVLDKIDGEPAWDWFESRSEERFLAGGNSTIHRTRTETYSGGVVMPEGGKVPQFE